VETTVHILGQIKVSFGGGGGCALCEITWKNIYRGDRSHVRTLRMHIACWIPKATDTHTLRICNTYYHSTAIKCTGSSISVMLYVFSLSCLQMLVPYLYSGISKIIFTALLLNYISFLTLHYSPVGEQQPPVHVTLQSYCTAPC
jgi:hypothetical protein